ncbi:MAG: hypothetical protein INR71_12060, partial [Terriglobus roseus]|nr:hypothetical protein [Terriglobus roseus]
MAAFPQDGPRPRQRTGTNLSNQSRHAGSPPTAKPLVDPSLLPDSRSPSLRLVQATPAEVLRQLRANSEEWRGSLREEQYLRREGILAAQELAREGGMTTWALVADGLPMLESAPPPRLSPSSVDGQMQPPSPPHHRKVERERVVLSACETIRKRALVRRRGERRVRDAVCHGVAGVFTRPEF